MDYEESPIGPFEIPKLDIAKMPDGPVPAGVSLEEILATPEFAPLTQPEIKYDEAKDPNPGGLARSDWEKRLSPRLRNVYDMIAHLFALGLTVPEVSKRIGYSKPWLTKLLANSDFEARVSGLRKQIYVDDLDQRLKLELPQAIQVLHDILNDPLVKPQTRAQVALSIMERTHGKPTQEVKHSVGTLSELFAELDAIRIERHIPRESLALDVPTLPPHHEGNVEEKVNGEIEELEQRSEDAQPANAGFVCGVPEENEGDAPGSGGPKTPDSEQHAPKDFGRLCGRATNDPKTR